MDHQKYLFRRQFILGPRYANNLKRWKKVRLYNKLFLSAHPELEISKVTLGSNIIVLLGYILDPFNPLSSNQEIIHKIINNISEADDIFSHLDTMCGRFVFFVKIKDELRIFNDAGGYRQVFYYKDQSGNIWCGSQPSVIAEECALRMDQKISKDLSKLPLIRSEISRWFPGNVTLYSNIFHLIPNHYLNLNSGEVRRNWPSRNLEPISVEKAAERSAKILQGVVEAGLKRFQMALTVTAGYDTRVLLAACKMHKDKIHHISHTHGTLNENGPDIQVPRKLLGQLGIEHHIAYHTEKVNREFEILFKKNVTGAKDLHKKNAYAFFKYFEKNGTEMVVAQGEAGGLAQRFYRSPPSIIKVDEKALATAIGMRRNRTAERAIKGWLESARKAVSCGINILDLLYWEMRLGNWSTLAVSSYDIVFESFLPFNCRKIMEYFVRVDIKNRLARKDIHIFLIRQMWPDLLQYPINPPFGMKEKIMTKIKEKAFYDTLRSLKFMYHYLIGSR